MDLQVIRLNGHNTIYLDREPFSDYNNSIQGLFTYEIGGTSKIILNKPTNRIEFRCLAIKIGQISSLTKNQDNFNKDFMVICINTNFIKSVYKNEEPFFLKNSIREVKAISEAAISHLIKNFYTGFRELLNSIRTIPDELLIAKIKELLFLLSHVKSFRRIAKNLKWFLWEENFEFKANIEKSLFKVNSIKDLAEKNNMSLSKFKRKFHEIYKTTPKRYIVNKRIEKVAELLKQTNDPISIIGYDCGFEAPAHLTRVFKAKYNKTPTEYRLQYLN